MALPMDSSSSGIYTISLYDSSQDFNSRQELRPKSLISETSQDFNDTANEQQLHQQNHEQQQQTDKENNANDKQNKINSKMKKLSYLFIDLFIGICVLMLILAMERDWLPSKRGGFFCNDPKISYKYTGDTITTTLLLCITILMPIVFFYLCELVVYIPLSSPHRNSNNNKNNYLTRSNYGLKSILINKCGKQMLLRYREYMIGLAFLTVVVEVGKTIFGEPRPHFLDTCQPDAAVNCTLLSNQYISDYKCTASLKSYRVKDSYKSFPSGHAAFSAYTGLFIIWYLQNRLIFSSNSSTSWLLKPVIQLLCFTWMFITPLSRVTDFRHHWWDALAGTILGLLFTYYAVIVLSNKFMISDNDLDELMMINNSTNNKTHIDNQFNQMLHNNHHNNKYHHHPSIKRLLSTNSTTSTIIYKNNDHHDNDTTLHYQTDKELTDINTYQ